MSHQVTSAVIGQASITVVGVRWGFVSEGGLGAVVCVEHDTPGEVPPPASSRDGRLDRVEAELGAEVVGDRPAEKTARAGVDDRCEIQPALIGPDVGRVADPQLVEVRPREVSPDQVNCRDLGGVTARRAHLAPAQTAARALAAISAPTVLWLTGMPSRASWAVTRCDP